MAGNGDHGSSVGRNYLFWIYLQLCDFRNEVFREKEPGLCSCVRRSCKRRCTIQGPGTSSEGGTEICQENEDTTLILSGGQGFGEDITEAKCMENYLTAHGISQERLVLEEKSTSTKENLKFSDELTGCSKKNTGILSNNFHVYRAVKLAEKLGYKHPYGIAAVSDPIMQVHYVVREVAALVKEKLRGNI